MGSETKTYYNGEGQTKRLDQSNNYDVDVNVAGTGNYAYTYTTQYQYNLLGNLLQATDPKSYVTSQTYD